MSPVENVRRACLGLPETEERISHGEPSWFIIKGKQFVSLDDHHHDEDRLAIWCAAPEGSQRIHVESDPEMFFVPPYVGHRGWIGVRIDRQPNWTEVGELVIDAYLTVAPVRLVELVTERFRL